MEYDEQADIEKRIHEAGHAVAAWVEGRPILAVEIAALEKSGAFHYADDPAFRRRFHNLERDAIASVIRVSVSGPLAQSWLADGSGSPRPLKELEHHGGEVDAENVRNLLGELTPGDEGVLLAEAASSLRRNWDAVRAVALALRETRYGFLGGHEAVQVIEEALARANHPAGSGRDPAYQEAASRVPVQSGSTGTHGLGVRWR